MPPSIILMSGGVSRPHNEMQVIKDIKRIHWLPGLFTPLWHEYARRGWTVFGLVLTVTLPVCSGGGSKV